MCWGTCVQKWIEKGKSIEMFSSNFLTFKVLISWGLHTELSVKTALICMHCTVWNCTRCAIYSGPWSMCSDLEPCLSNLNTLLTAATAVAVVVFPQIPSNRLDTIPLLQRTALTRCCSLRSLLFCTPLPLSSPVYARSRFCCRLYCRRLYCQIFFYVAFDPDDQCSAASLFVCLPSVIS